MAKNSEPNPPSRREEDFPKTTTIPDGWVTDALMAAYNGENAVPQRDERPLPQQIVVLPATGHTNGRANGHSNSNSNGNNNGHSNGQAQAGEPDEDRMTDLFTRRLDPFPSPGDAFGMWL